MCLKIKPQSIKNCFKKDIVCIERGERHTEKIIAFWSFLKKKVKFDTETKSPDCSSDILASSFLKQKLIAELKLGILMCHTVEGLSY